ncbi:uncharacterized protein TNCV_4663631 [Trichonephila clavipes]|uniref:Uncharacterized protein n=1 Tax=Trichonephila clavipes TaxID=2585209 RepID=A0A8X6VIP8_TRICX|nr:uncharacterized protein TNCV_4663631 [Trichonephila clavipes]
MNFGLGPGHRRRRHSTTWRDVITELGFRLSLGGGIMKGTVLIWKLLCFTYILALVRPVPEKIPIETVTLAEWLRSRNHDQRCRDLGLNPGHIPSVLRD